MFGKFKTVHLLGSTKGNEQRFRHVEKELTKQGYICFTPVLYGYEACRPYLKMLTDMCTEKLNVCDICVIVTPEHIGESTENRIEQAIEMGKPVYVWSETDSGALIPYDKNKAVRRKVSFKIEYGVFTEITIPLPDDIDPEDRDAISKYCHDKWMEMHKPGKIAENTKYVISWEQTDEKQRKDTQDNA